MITSSKNSFLKEKKRMYENGEISELEYLRIENSVYKSEVEELEKINATDWKCDPFTVGGITSIICVYLATYHGFDMHISEENPFWKFIYWFLLPLGCIFIWWFFREIVQDLLDRLNSVTEHGKYNQPDSKKKIKHYIPYLLYLLIIYILYSIH